MINNFFSVSCIFFPLFDLSLMQNKEDFYLSEAQVNKVRFYDWFSELFNL